MRWAGVRLSTFSHLNYSNTYTSVCVCKLVEKTNLGNCGGVVINLLKQINN